MKEKFKAAFNWVRHPWVQKTGRITLFITKWTVIFGVLGSLLAAGTVFGYVSALVKDDPVRSRDYIMQEMQQDFLTGFVFFNDDSPLGQLRTDEDRRLATFNEIPQQLRDAVLAIEDAKFYEHPGVDVNGVFRAILQRVKQEEVQTGGSTITQQLARRVFLSPERDLGRKLKEIFLSMRLERVMSKDEIFTAYLNKIPYGNGATGYNLYGIKAAAKGIFNIDDLAKLNVAQSAYLAGLPQQPSNLSAFSSTGDLDAARYKKAVARQQLVLKRMLEEQKITPAEYDSALAFNLQDSLAETSIKAYTTYPYLMAEVEKRASDILLKLKNPDISPDTGKKADAYNEALKEAQLQMQRGGYRIYTTIDKTLYDSMHEISDNKKNFSPDDPKKGLEQIGAIMLDNRTGAILSMIEGRDFKAEQLNHATQAYRQPGSTMKPIAAYVPAMEKGAIQPGGVIDDVPVILKDGQKGFHIPENWDNQFHGLITARVALNKSYNIPAIKLFLNAVGIKEAWDYARKMGITSITKSDESAQTGVIGGLSKGVTVQELTGAYATIANKGVYQEVFMIRKILDSEGRVVYDHNPKATQVFSEETAYLMTDMMRTVISDPGGTAADLKTKFTNYGKVPIVGKTGSTQDDADAWFIGYSPDITLGVWAGYDQPIHKLSKATGGTNRAKNIWALVMDDAIKKKPGLFPAKGFERPANIVDMTVSSYSGKLPSGLVASAGKLHRDLFNKKFLPKEVDDVLINMKYISYNGINYLPQPGTPDDMLMEKIVIRRQEPISAIMNKITELMYRLSPDKRKPISDYLPLDAGEDAPSETDPRKEDGQLPTPPSGLVLTRTGDAYRLSFNPSSSTDVVGYRLYQSDIRGNYEKTGRTIFEGETTIFKDIPASGNIVAYAVSAVDVSGNESPSVKTAVGDGSGLFFPPITENGQIGGNPQSPANLPNGSRPQPSPSGSPSLAPSTPVGIHSVPLGTSVRLFWQANPQNEKVKQYIVYYSEKEKETYNKIGITNKSEFDVGMSKPGFYKVSASSDKGESPPSLAIQIK